MAQAKRMKNIEKIQMQRRTKSRALAILEFLGGFAAILLLFTACIIGPEILRDLIGVPGGL